VTVSIEFLVTALVVALIPGTGVVYTVSNGLFGGRRASALAAFGCTLGIVPHLIAATLGLSAVLHASAEVFHLIKLAGVAYLLYLAWGLWRSSGSMTLDDGRVDRSARRVIVRGITVNLLNPKLTIFFFAFLPQFVSASGAGAPLQMLVLSSVFMAMTLVVFAAYGVCAALLRDRVLSRPRLVDRIRKAFAASFAVLGARLAVESR
jgi:threonine/homoserine/homoserine lactone efflux protein